MYVGYNTVLQCPVQLSPKKMGDIIPNIILRQLPNPPPAHNPNYRGSRCLTLTLEPMYPNPKFGAKINCGITV